MVEQPGTEDQPYCSACGYVLTGAIESSKCPECGRPLVEVLTRRNRWAESGKRWRSNARLFGLPVIDIALGPKGGEARGRAKGIVAIGDIATGWLAIGGMARGFVAIGGFAIGAFSIGGMSVGAITSVGGWAIAGFAAGGGAMGGVAAGGGAAGYIAQGGGALGYYARAGGAWGRHIIDYRPAPATGPDQAAIDMFDRFSWFFGAWPTNALSSLQPFAILAGVTIAIGLLILLAALAMNRRS